MPGTNFIRLYDAALGTSVLDNLTANTNSKTFIEETLNAALKSKLQSAFLDNNQPVLAALIAGMDPVDIAASKDVPLRTFVASEVQHKLQTDTGLQRAIGEAVSEISDKTTVGDLLALDIPVRAHPLFQVEVQKVELSSLLSTSPGIENRELQDQFIRLYAAHEGPVQDFWSNLRTQPEFAAPGVVESLQFTLQLGLLTQDNVPLVKALQQLHQQGKVQSIRDLAKLDTEAWTKLITTPVDGNMIDVPASISGAMQQEKVANYVNAMMEMLQEAFPTAYVAQSVAKQPEIDLPLVQRVLAHNVHLDPGDSLPVELARTDISAADHGRVKASLEALRQEINRFPAFDYKAALSTGASFHNPIRQVISQFFVNEPDFDFRDAHIDTYLTEHAATAFKGIDDKYQDAVSSQLKCMQRIFQVTPHPQKMNVLLSAGLYSAHSIASIPRAAFTAQFQEKLGGETEASKLYDKAQYVHAATLNLFTQVYQAMNDVSPRVIGSPTDLQDTIKKIPNWTSLFGSLELCDCEKCRSIYSPAAYLVDLLQFLSKSLPSPQDKTPQKVLFERRPDLQYIQLTCENANISLPYVDLVNEILETYVALADTNIDDPRLVKNTPADATTEELSATPANTNDGAYDKLKQAIYPLSLPFNRWLEIARAYLQQLGSSRYEVMKTFQRNSTPTTLSPSDVEIACEYLSISPEEYAILVNTNLQPAMYGYPATTDVSKLKVTLAAVPELLKRTGIQYLDLIELLKTRFLNPNRAMLLDGPAGANCDLAKTMITNLEDNALRKMHRFIRLWRRSSWQIRELDKAITALGAKDIDDDLLTKLAQTKQLQTDLNLPLVQLLSFWAPIDTDGDDALYKRLFQNKAVLNPVDAAFALKQDGTELATTDTPNAKISVHVSTILAALRLRAADLTALIASEATDDKLNLANLSALYRCTVLARALKLSIQDFLALKTLTGSNPFQLGSPAATVEFQGEAKRVLQSSFSIAQLNYLYRHSNEPRITPPQENVNLLIENLQSSLKKIANDNVMVPDPTGNVLPRKLSILWGDDALVNEAMKLLTGSAIYTTPLDNLPSVNWPDSLKDKISYASKKLRYTGNMTEPDKKTLLGLSSDASYQRAINDLFQQPRNFISTYMASFLNLDDATKKLLDDATQTTEQKYLYVLPPLMAYLQVILGKRLIKQVLCDALSLDTATADLLLESVLKSHTDPTQSAMVDFLALLNSANTSSAFASFSLLHKTSLLVNTFKMTVEEVRYLCAHGSDFGGFDLSKLPLTPSGFNVDFFNQWKQLNDLFRLRDSLPRNGVGLIKVFEAASTSNTTNQVSYALVAVTDWDRAELTSLTSAFKLTDADFKNATKILLLQACFSLSKRLGVSVQQLFTWATTEPDSSQARDIISVVKAQYDDEQWLTAATSLNNGLRETQKAALIAYLLQMQKMKDAEVTDSSQLYEYFLIDPEMSACMMTSRIVQAYSTVQLFVQRCLMNLEPDVSPHQFDVEQVEQWKWMKRYSLWEANRKVFLYPENWLEPALRDDKSPFFKELETELLQNDITMDTVEQAFLNYLEKLKQVSNLEICGMYWQKEPVGYLNWLDKNNLTVDILHVFARTFAVPHIYYYRRLINRVTWTPWEKVNVDIEGDHLIPIVYNRRLHIFWPIFSEKADQTLADQKDFPKKYLEVKFGWSDYARNTWSSKRISTEYTFYDPIGRDPQKEVPGYTNLQEERPSFFFQLDIFPNSPVYMDVDPKADSKPLTRLIDITFNSCTDNLDFVEPTQRVLSARDYTSSPLNSQIKFMAFEEDDKADKLLFNSHEKDRSGNPILIPILNKTPSLYRILPPLQARNFFPKMPFFYQDKGQTAVQDEARTYFVIPSEEPDGGHQAALREPNRVVLGHKLSLVARQASLATNTMETLPVFERGNPISGVGRGTELPDLVQPTIINEREGVLSDGRLRLEKGVALQKFTTHFHPHVCHFIEALSQYGIPGLLRLEQQELTDDKTDGTNKTLFETQYDPQSQVHPSYPREDVDFDYGDASAAYVLYNWELFFHIPLLIATKLSQNQRFEEAQQWFHYIFNPITNSSDSSPQRYWQVQPFQKPESERIGDLLALLDYRGNDPEKVDSQAKMQQRVDDWRKNPFNPYLIARLRLTAYQKNVVMKYMDNLIAWGDQLFRMDTMESINEATLLYILASEILGPRPERVPTRGRPHPQTYKDLQPQLDSFSNALVNLENQFPFSSASPSGNGGTGTSGVSSVGTTFYFCIPQNDKLLEYWDTVADRLFKIRHCMNIKGMVRQLPLFAPPIDVSLLVQAAAMGVDVSSALNDINAATPHYRFTYMLQKALELCSDLEALGAALLSALEKRDAEALAILRAGQEANLLKAVLLVKVQQLKDAEAALEGLQKSKDVVQGRFDYYSSREPRNDHESEQIERLNSAELKHDHSQWFQLLASSSQLIPAFNFGVSGISSPVVTASFGGPNLGGAAQAMGQYFALQSSQDTHKATMASIEGGWDRRQDDWTFQASQAQKEMDQIEKQIAAAQIRVTIAQTEIDNQLKQIQNAQTIEDFMRSKYTNQELYDWMASQVSAIFFQCYQMTYDIAKQVEKAYRFERGLTTSNFIQFGYWDSLKKGLLSGERLYLDLKRLELAYIDQNEREYEITKHISLVLHDPLALIALKETGICIVELPEMLFDMDYPGHYMRRIKNVTLTIPCVAGPYTSINCTLTLLSNRVRVDSNAQGAYTEQDEDPRFVYDFGAVESIATSTAQNDSGLFELNFRDERYLPFEGSGVISRWRIDMPRDCNAFDFETISDIILKISYTAREGGDLLRKTAKDARDKVLDTQTQQARLFSAKHEFSSEWHRFLYPADTALVQVLPLTLTIERFPYLFRGKQLIIHAMKLFLKLKEQFTYKDDKALAFTLKEGSTSYQSTFMAGGSPVDALPYAEPLKGKEGKVGMWSIEIQSGDIAKLDNTLQKKVTVNGQIFAHFNPDAIDDIWLVCEYTVK